MRYLRNALTILVTTALVALVFYVGVEATTEIAAATTGKTTSAAASAGQTYLCPVSGCTSTSCHAISGTSAQGGASTAASDGNAGSGTTMTCPATGCTASTCHGATGSPPPGGGGYGRGRRGSSADSGIVFE
jgi:hypothetical protein